MSDIKWIKITTDIFDDEKILLIESMPDADSIIVIWFKLLVLAGRTNNCGALTISDAMPYSDEMLAAIFRRPLNTVRLALKVFEEYGMIEIINDTICIPKWGVYQNIEGMDKVREQTRERVARYRERQKLAEPIENSTDSDDVTLHNVTVTEQNKNKNKKKNKSKEDIYTGLPENLIAALKDFEQMRKSIKKPMSDRALKMLVNRLDKLSGDNVELKIKILEQSIYHNWQDVYPLKENFDDTQANGRNGTSELSAFDKAMEAFLKGDTNDERRIAENS